MPIEQQAESNRKIAEFLYNTGMSMVDMMAMTPMGTTGMSLIMGTNAAADSLIDAKARGLSDEQAMTISIISGAAEVIAEKYSLNRLFDGKIAVSSLKNSLIQGGVEASEEIVTELANTLADVFVLGDQSAFEDAISAYMEQGMNYMQAQNKAFVDVLADIAKAGAGGFLSGGIMGGAVDVAKTNAQGRSIIDETAQTFIKQGQTPEQAQQSAIEYLKEELRAVGVLADEGTTAYELSQRTGDMSTGDIGRAYLANREQIQNIVSSGKATTAQEKFIPEQPALETGTHLEAPEQAESSMTEQEIAEIESIIQREKERLAQMPYQNSAAATRRKEKIAALESVVQSYKNIDTAAAGADNIIGGEYYGETAGRNTGLSQRVSEFSNAEINAGREGGGRTYVRRVTDEDRAIFAEAAKQKIGRTSPEFQLIEESVLPTEQAAALEYFSKVTRVQPFIYSGKDNLHLAFTDRKGRIYINGEALAEKDAVFADIIASHEFAHNKPELLKAVYDAVGDIPYEERVKYLKNIVSIKDFAGLSLDDIKNGDIDPVEEEIISNTIANAFYWLRTGDFDTSPLDVPVNFTKAAYKIIAENPYRWGMDLIDQMGLESLQKELDSLPMKDSRRGIEIRRKINDLQAQMRAQTETEAPQAGGTDVTDTIGGNAPVPDDVRNNAENRKRNERDHEKLKKQLDLPEDITSEIETYVKKNVPIERVVRLLTEDGFHPQMIADYYSSYKELNDSERAAVRYRKEILNKRYTRIRDAIARTLPKWEDKKSGVAYARSTQERNIQDIAKKAPEAARWIIENIFEPEHRNEAARNRWMNQYADRARAHNLTEAENEFVHVLITERDLNQRPYGRAKMNNSVL